MKAEDLLNQLKDAVTVQRVFGEPIERDGVTIIPVARVMGGGGGGHGPMMRRAWMARAEGRGAEAPGQAEAPGEAAGPHETANGMGMGFMAVPVGVYVIEDGEVRWKPAVDVNRLATMALAIGGFGLVTLLVLRGRRRETHHHFWDRHDRARLQKMAAKAARGSAMAGLAPVAAARGSKLFERMPDLAERGLYLLERLPDRFPEAAERSAKMSPKVEAAVEAAMAHAGEMAERLQDLPDRLPDFGDHLPHAAHLGVHAPHMGFHHRTNGKS